MTPARQKRKAQDAAKPTDAQPDAAQAFRQAVWQIVAAIPKGQVATYGQIAKLAGYPSHSRHVGRVLKDLPKRTKLPWHRVLNASLKISYRESGGEEEQARRLAKEGVTLVGGRVPRSHRWEAGG